MESQPQQLPATSPLSAARRISAVPRYPETSWTGSPRAVRRIRAVLSVDDPGARPASLTGTYAAFNFSRLVMPLARVKAQTM
jgi:hypothetical protein